MILDNPFPGMDPYLEKFWPDVHASLIIYIRDQLEEQLPSQLIARVEERIVFETDADPVSAYPDVKISQRRGRAGAALAESGGVAVAEPVYVEVHGEPATETFIHVYESAPGQRLVTVIEVLSMANKLAGEGQRQYRQKQQELCAAQVSLVEIDLLRGGKRVLSVPMSRVPARARTEYQVCVRRGWRPWRWEVYPAPLRAPLPAVRIPLRRTDEDIRLDLQSIVNQAYRKGRYGATIDYSVPADPPLAVADRRWAKGLIRKRPKK